MASLCFFRWPGAYAEAPFDKLPLLCITCPGAVGCWAMAGAAANAAKVPITARCLIIGYSFLCAPPITPAESEDFPSAAKWGGDNIPAAIGVLFPLGFQSPAPDRQAGIDRRILARCPPE